MQQTDNHHFPQFAPLATPLVRHILEYQEISLCAGPSPTLHGVHFSQPLHARWSLFGRLVQEKRQRVYRLMTPALQKESPTGTPYIVPGWLRETLGLFTPPAQKRGKKERITAQTLSMWSERHILRYLAWGQLETQSAAGVLVARLLDDIRERSWLPRTMKADEPYWWCYSQALPTDSKPPPVLPCPVPLPEHLPPATLLWTPWVGAGWDPCWVQIGSLGAIRWAGALLDDRGRVQWMVSEADLARWDPEITALDLGFLKQDMLSALAHVALLRLALTRLAPPLLLRSKATRRQERPPEARSARPVS